VLAPVIHTRGRKEFAVYIVPLHLSALAIAAIYYLYRDQCHARLEKVAMLRERVAFLLWSAAQHDIAIGR
jgi:hypothetical protein